MSAPARPPGGSARVPLEGTRDAEGAAVTAPAIGPHGRQGRRTAVAVMLISAPLVAGAAEDAALWQVRADEPRAFGQRVGDVVERRFHIDTPPGRHLDLASLPTVGRRGKSIELREVRWSEPGWFGRGHTLTLAYQVFVSPTEVRTIEMPAVMLRFEGGPRTEDLRLDAWPMTLAPLAPAEPSPRTGLGELRPPAPPPAIDTTPARSRLAACAALALLGLAYLARVYLVAPWWAGRGRPFAQAWAALRRGSGSTVAGRQQAYRSLHRALDRTAGEVLFEQGLPQFLARHPRYATLGAELGEFFARSRAEFFGQPARDGEEAVRWLRGLCRRCRDLERGAA